MTGLLTGNKLLLLSRKSERPAAVFAGEGLHSGVF